MTCEANEDGVTEEGIYFEAYDIVADQGAELGSTTVLPSADLRERCWRGTVAY